jgi:hypothetical protein
MKYLILILITFNAASQTVPRFKFGFKDGTVVWGKVYSDSAHKVNKDGLTIETSEGKIYLHHYPVYKKAITQFGEQWVDHGNGTYIPLKEPVDYTPHIPPVNETNPWSIPNCVPTRINFIQFDKRTLRDLYNSYSRYNSKEARSIAKGISLAYNKGKPVNTSLAYIISKNLEYKRKVETFHGLFLKFGNPNPHGKSLIWGEDYLLKENYHPYKQGYYKK